MITKILIQFIFLLLFGKIIVVLLFKILVYLINLNYIFYQDKQLNYTKFSSLNKVEIRKEVAIKLGQKLIHESHTPFLSKEIESFQIDFGCQPESICEYIDSYEFLFYYKTKMTSLNYELNKNKLSPLFQIRLKSECGPQRLNSSTLISLNSLFGWNRDIDSIQNLYGALRHNDYKNYKGNNNYGIAFCFEKKLLFSYLYQKEKNNLKFSYPFLFLNHPCPTCLLEEYWTEWELWQLAGSKYFHAHVESKILINFFLSQKNKKLHFKKIYQYNTFKNYTYYKKLKIQNIQQIIKILKNQNKIYSNLPLFASLHNKNLFNFYYELLNCDDEFIYKKANKSFLQFDLCNLSGPYNYNIPNKSIPFIYNYASKLREERKLKHPFSSLFFKKKVSVFPTNKFLQNK